MRTKAVLLRQCSVANEVTSSPGNKLIEHSLSMFHPHNYTSCESQQVVYN